MICTNCKDSEECEFLSGIWMSDYEEFDDNPNNFSLARLYYCPINGYEELRLIKDIETPTIK